jgi:predicted DNA-binding transcriptional regulator AlpA
MLHERHSIAPSGPISDREYPSTQFMTDAQFATTVHVDTRTTLRWRNTGEGPPFIRVGTRRILYRCSDIDEWLKSRTHRHRAAELAQEAA